MPNFAGEFGGVLRHAVTYRSPAEVAGKRVLVVGCGNSGADIACDATKSAASVSLSMRRGYWFVPKFIGGHPTDMVFARRAKLPVWFTPSDAEALLTMVAGRPSAFGLPEPDHEPFASHPVMNGEVLQHVGHGRIRPQGDIERLEGASVRYADGTSEQIDEIILATGYRTSTPYLDPGMFPLAGANRPDLWMRVAHWALPTLYALGFIEANSGVYRLFDKAAALIVAMIKARALCGNDLPLPPEPATLHGHQDKIDSSRHVGYVDAGTYSATLDELTASFELQVTAVTTP
jgi:hypothetical protein